MKSYGRRRWARGLMSKAYKYAVSGITSLLRKRRSSRSKSYIQLRSRVRRNTPKRKLRDQSFAKSPRSHKRSKPGLLADKGNEQGQMGAVISRKYGKVYRPSKSLSSQINKINGQRYVYEGLAEMPSDAMNTPYDTQAIWTYGFGVPVEEAQAVLNARVPFDLTTIPGTVGTIGNYSDQMIERVYRSIEFQFSNRSNITTLLNIYELHFHSSLFRSPTTSDINGAVILSGWANAAAAVAPNPISYKSPHSWTKGCINRNFYTPHLVKSLSIDPGEMAVFKGKLGTKMLNPLSDLDVTVAAKPGCVFYMFIANGLYVSNQGGSSPSATYHGAYAPVCIQAIIKEAAEYRYASRNPPQSNYESFLNTDIPPASLNIINDETDAGDLFKENL